MHAGLNLDPEGSRLRPYYPGAPQQRKYPWGNTLDPDKANLWATGAGTTVPVFACAEGASIGGVYQLIGNVWEWTTADYGAWHADERIADRQNCLKSLRGCV
jgi:iron(II)-dependent oxidoreductase